MKKYFDESGTFLKSSKPYPQHWANFSSGRSNFGIAAICSVRDNFIRIDVNITKKDSKNRFNKLKTLYEIDSMKHFGEELTWNELPDAKVSIIHLRRNADVSDRSLWAEQHQWFRENLEEIDRYFRPKIKDL